MLFYRGDTAFGTMSKFINNDGAKGNFLWLNGLPLGDQLGVAVSQKGDADVRVREKRHSRSGRSSNSP